MKGTTFYFPLGWTIDRACNWLLDRRVILPSFHYEPPNWQLVAVIKHHEPKA